MKVEDFDMFSTLLKQRSGLVLSRDKAYLLEVAADAGRAQVEHEGRSTSWRSRSGTRREEALLRDITEAMTTNRVVVLPRPEAVRAVPAGGSADDAGEPLRAPFDPHLVGRPVRAGRKPIRSACFCWKRVSELDGWRFEIVGTDLSSEMVEKSKAGIYTQFEVQRGLPITHLVKYFRQVGDKWQVSDKIRQMVNFREYNLLTDLTPLGQFDVVFCRNVLIYFDQPTKGKVLDSIAKLMPADGVLYLGGAETVLGITERFKPMENQRGLYVVNPPRARSDGQGRGGLK